MKNSIKTGFLFVMALVAFGNVNAQKKTKHFSVQKTIEISADEIWAAMGGDYGAIANSHPKIIKSEYTKGSLASGEGAERMCYFNEKGTQYLHEKMINFDPNNMSFTNTILKAGKFPVDPDNTTALYKVTDLGNNKCRVSIDMTYRTSPAMMGGMMKGSFIKLMSDYFIALEHHVKTGEIVNQENFKKIKKEYGNDVSVVKK